MKNNFQKKFAQFWQKFHKIILGIFVFLLGAIAGFAIFANLKTPRRGQSHAKNPQFYPPIKMDESLPDNPEDAVIFDFENDELSGNIFGEAVPIFEIPKN